MENKQTLLHYLVDTIERKFPDCANFTDELAHVDRASRVSLENVQRTLRQMDASLRNLEQDLANARLPQTDNDRFAEVMTVSLSSKFKIYFYNYNRFSFFLTNIV